MEELVHFVHLLKLEPAQFVICLLKAACQTLIIRKTVLPLKFCKNIALIALVSAKNEDMVGVRSLHFGGVFPVQFLIPEEGGSATEGRGDFEALEHGSVRE